MSILRLCLLRSNLGHVYIKWSTVCESSWQEQVGSSVILNRCRYVLVIPCPVIIAVSCGDIVMRSFILRRTEGKNFLQTAPFVVFAQSASHWISPSSFHSDTIVHLGFLRYATSRDSSAAASFAVLSAISLPSIPIWALTHPKWIDHFFTFSLFMFSLICSMMLSWLEMFLNRASVTWLSVNMATFLSSVCRSWLLRSRLNSHQQYNLTKSRGMAKCKTRKLFWPQNYNFQNTRS